ncbi:hypothetical protein PR202_ga00269 [Eleusine coracana subsp. coracana]|uniref:non-specific serine/threonine protein kinase n=1 Tax=Eleusine coracana subsp. coracana TaxID=191504 RepID=A0AAV5BBU2_ELECO|nr:hypothetical protein PR202_ga00269 [Eleusine coracana subsp. coracana]
MVATAMRRAVVAVARSVLPPSSRPVRRRALCTAGGSPQDAELEAATAVREVVCSGAGSLDEVGGTLERLGVVVSPALVRHVVDSCGERGGSGRRLLRFLAWCRSKDPMAVGDEALDSVIVVLAQVGDLTAMRIAVSDAEKDGFRMAPETFTAVVEALVKAGRKDEAVRLFRGLEQQRLLPQPGVGVRGAGLWSSSLAMVQALCMRGHAREAEGVVWHHKSELSVEPVISIVQRSLLHGWCVHGNAKEARRVLDDMKSSGVPLGLPSFNDFLNCVCHRNLRFNPSALVPEAMDVFAEMRSYGVAPAASSFNILLSCLGRARRVKEAYRVLYMMIEGKAGCAPDWVSYYLVVRVLYLTGRIVRGKRLVDAMLESGVLPTAKFFQSLIGVLCGTEQVDHALDMFKLMKRCELVDTRIYDLLIEKLCRNGRFDLGRELWDDATKSGLVLGCSEDLLDPLKTEEARCMTKARRLGVPTPVLYAVDPLRHTLTFEYVDGLSVKDILLQFGSNGVNEEHLNDIATQIGNAVGKLHDGGLVHGDLTTSNMIIKSINNQLVLIDFGLSFTSTIPEDKAVDLYVLERALISMHSSCGNVMEKILAAYRKASKQWCATTNKLAQVRQRGRKRTMIG